MDNLLDKLKICYSQDLEQRKILYSPTADAYNKIRPRYPQEVIDRVIELTQLSSDARILEIGCGPGNATISFAQLGCSITCVEPNQDFCQMAQQNCQSYPNVKICNASFEEWELESEKYSAILAATSIHWISPEVAYSKAARALKDNGFLILLWNVIPEYTYELYQEFLEIYQRYAPSSTRYQGKEAHEEDLRGFEQIIVNSGLFKDVVFEQFVYEVTYSTDNYLALLSTFSHYIKLEEPARNSLFTSLQNKIEKKLGGNVQIPYVSAFHVARKI